MVKHDLAAAPWPSHLSLGVDRPAWLQPVDTCQMTLLKLHQPRVDADSVCMLACKRMQVQMKRVDEDSNASISYDEFRRFAAFLPSVEQVRVWRVGFGVGQEGAAGCRNGRSVEEVPSQRRGPG